MVAAGLRVNSTSARGPERSAQSVSVGTNRGGAPRPSAPLIPARPPPPIPEGAHAGRPPSVQSGATSALMGPVEVSFSTGVAGAPLGMESAPWATGQISIRATQPKSALPPVAPQLNAAGAAAAPATAAPGGSASPKTPALKSGAIPGLALTQTAPDTRQTARSIGASTPFLRRSTWMSELAARRSKAHDHPKRPLPDVVELRRDALGGGQAGSSGSGGKEGGIMALLSMIERMDGSKEVRDAGFPPCPRGWTLLSESKHFLRLPQAEESSSEMSSRMRTMLSAVFLVLEHVSDAVQVANAEGFIEFVNQAWENMTGWRKDEARALGRHRLPNPRGP